MSESEVIRRFNTLYLGDSVLELLEIRTGSAECCLRFNALKVLSAEGASIFEPAADYKPAALWLKGVHSVSFDGAYQLNSTVVDFGAEPGKTEGTIEFYFDLTGGSDPEAFLVRMRIIARNFEIGQPEFAQGPS